MLRSEINELEITVDAILNERITGNPSAYQTWIDDQVRSVKILCSGLKKKWTHELLSSAKEPVIKRYVQYHQAGIIRLSEKVSRMVPAVNSKKNKTEKQNNPHTQVTAALENVLEFLRYRFYQFFDIDHKATIFYCQNLNQTIVAIKRELKAYQSVVVDQSLITTILTSVDELIAEGQVSGISYRQADLALNLVRMTHQLLAFETKTTSDDLIHALYQQNFNALRFLNWYKEYISVKLAAIKEQSERKPFMDAMISELAGIYVSPEKAFQPDLPSTDLAIIPWLREQTGSGEKSTYSRPDKIKFPLNLSVPQFALFIRIFYKAGCFTMDNVAMITRFFTEHFTTKKQAHISRKSFGHAFYSLDQSAAAMVREFLQKMLNYLNKTYFP